LNECPETSKIITTFTPVHMCYFLHYAYFEVKISLTPQQCGNWIAENGNSTHQSKGLPRRWKHQIQYIIYTMDFHN